MRDAGPADAGALDAGGADAGEVDAGLEDAGRGDAGPSLVTITGERELRGVWVATVQNLDWPSARGLSADAGRAELEAMVGGLADAGLNALFFQARAESDALYDSALEPWARALTGTQGQSPGWDPLATLLELAHARGLEVHAWLNPYRALVNASAPTAATHVTRTLSPFAVTYGSGVVMNPGSAQVRQHVVDVVRDLLDRYDVDGVHFDDYFYPYPDAANTPFPDDSLYQAYRSKGGSLGRADWRRDNVNSLIREVMGVVVNEHPHVRFGVAPFGLYKPGIPSGTTGLSSYDDLYCDAPRWMSEGWVDYLAPQLYWPITRAAQSYRTLANWWVGGATGGRHVFPGHATYQLGTSAAWSLDEYRNQLAITRSLRGSGALGDLHFRAAHLLANREGVSNALAQSEYARPALVPQVPRAAASLTPLVPQVVVQSGALAVSNPLPATVRFFALYRELAAGQYELARVVGNAAVTLPVASGAWVVTAVGRGGAESQGTRVVVP